MRSRGNGPRLAAALVAAGLLLYRPAVADIPAPRDESFPGTLRLEVDATDVERRIFQVRETIPVAGPGPLVLLQPRWLPGNHSPSGPLELLAGLVVTAKGEGLERRLAWRRDAEAMQAYHVEVPDGATELELKLQFASPSSSEQGRRVMTSAIVNVQWEKMLLYPAGHYSSRIQIEPSIRLPEGWSFASALTPVTRKDDAVRFRALTLEHLVDSPLFAGRYFRRYPLDPDPKGPATLNVFGDTADEVEATPAQVAAHAKLVREARTVFGSRHYSKYEFLLAISDFVGGTGLEHHQSSENVVDRGYFTKWDSSSVPGRDLLAHEMVHSWNGKFRRPADLWTPSYDVPMRNSLLWVYEGQTEFWGMVLAARSGLWSADQMRGALAMYAAYYDRGRAGREWRSLGDTTNTPIFAYRKPLPWVSWQRNAGDYYTESVFVWLDVDSRIRELSRDSRSLDTFAARFFGVDDGELGPKTYTFDDVVSTLGSVAKNDWAAFLRARVDNTGGAAPLDGLKRSGWQLVYKNQPSAFTKLADDERKQANFLYSLGFTVANDGGKLTEVLWGSPAFEAGLAQNTTLVAVNGRAYSAEVLSKAITAATANEAPIELLVRSLDDFRTVKIAYKDGLRYPHLERIPGTRDRLSELLKARTAASR